MKAWLLDDFTGLGALRLAETPTPTPGPGEVLLEVALAGLNPADRYLAERLYPLKPQLPHILGRDGIGIVRQVGPGVTEVKVGDKRLIARGDTGGMRPGTFAQSVVVPADNLVVPPAGWSDEQCAGASLVYLTAYQALTQWGSVQSGSVVLVTGASGGVGVASVQLAHAMGCTVVALSRSAEKAARLKELGADFTYDPGDAQWRRTLKHNLASRRVQIAVDNVGGKLFPEVIDTLGDKGCVSVVGRLAGPVPEFNTATLFFRRLRIGGVAVGAYTREESNAAWKDVLSLLAKTGAKPLVDQVFPFDQLIPAFERLARGPMGKVLLKVGA
jgi:NADPH2:quinone reductase